MNVRECLVSRAMEVGLTQEQLLDCVDMTHITPTGELGKSWQGLEKFKDKLSFVHRYEACKVKSSHWEYQSEFDFGSEGITEKRTLVIVYWR